MSGRSFIIFLSVVLGIWGLVHFYVFWRLSSVPWIAGNISRKTLIITGIAMWLSYVLARMVGSWNLGFVAYSLEFVASTWMGFVFLLFAALLCVDVFTLGGVLFAKWTEQVRGWAVIVAALLSVIALVQGFLPPVVTRHEVRLSGLPRDRDGMTLVAISDLHLGRLLGKQWLTQRINQINALEADCVVVVGDVLDGNTRQVNPLLPLLRELHAPLGVWAVSGNHEFYIGLDESLRTLEQAGWHVLRDESVEVVSGLVIAGVDDLTARQQFGRPGDPLEKALGNRPGGATILLSHSPIGTGTAARLGVGLMLSGHTHAGQIWPFNRLVQLRYPLVSGRGEVGGMTVIVGRGTGTWGPRMRLWRRSEILHITLRSGERG